MSNDIKQQLAPFAEVSAVDVDKVEVHGERATQVVVTLNDGRTVTGTFTTEDKAAFGGVEFSSRKDIGGLMASKVRSVLAGTADIN